MSLNELTFQHGNTIEARSIEALADEGQDFIDGLESDISDLESEKEDLEQDTEENGTDNSVRIEEIEKEIADKQGTVKVYEAEVEHLNDAHKALSNYSETAINDDYLDKYIEDQVRETNSEELEALSNLIASNINWSGIVEDSKQDYSSFELDGITYHFS